MKRPAWLAPVLLLASSVVVLAQGQGTIDPSLFNVSMTQIFWSGAETPKEITFRCDYSVPNLVDLTLLSPDQRVLLSAGAPEKPPMVYVPYNSVNTLKGNYYKIGTPDEMLQRFALGPYTIKTKYIDTASMKQLQAVVVKNLTKFPPRPVLTSPLVDQTDVDPNLTVVRWNQTPSDQEFLRYQLTVGKPGADGSWQVVYNRTFADIATTECQIPAGVLTAGTTYHVWLIVVYPGMQSQSGLQFVTASSTP